jgi:hypothetical protein
VIQQPLAILAPSLRVATVEAQERGLQPRPGRDWFYVQRAHSVYGRTPGPYAVRIPDGERLSDGQRDALDYMVQRGWEHL